MIMKLGDKKKIYVVLALLILFAFGFYAYFDSGDLSPGRIFERSSYVDLMFVSWLSTNGYLNEDLSLIQARALLDTDSLSLSVAEAITNELIVSGIVPRIQGERLANDLAGNFLEYIGGDWVSDIDRNSNVVPGSTVDLIATIPLNDISAN